MTECILIPLPVAIFISGFMAFIGTYALKKRVCCGPDIISLKDFIEVIIYAILFCLGIVGLTVFGITYIAEHFPCIEVI